MALFTQQQAEQAYNAIPDDGILKYLPDDTIPDEGFRYYSFEFEGRLYEEKIFSTELAMNSTPQEVKDYIIAYLVANCEVLPELPTSSTEVEAKA